MRAIAVGHRVILFVGALLLALALGAITLRQGGTFAALATSATPAPCLVDRDVPYYGGAAPIVARPPTPPAAPPPPPPAAPNPALPTTPGDRHIPPRPPLREPCQLRPLGSLSGR